MSRISFTLDQCKKIKEELEKKKKNSQLIAELALFQESSRKPKTIELDELKLTRDEICLLLEIKHIGYYRINTQQGKAKNIFKEKILVSIGELPQLTKNVNIDKLPKSKLRILKELNENNVELKLTQSDFDYIIKVAEENFEDEDLKERLNINSRPGKRPQQFVEIDGFVFTRDQICLFSKYSTFRFYQIARKEDHVDEFRKQLISRIMADKEKNKKYLINNVEMSFDEIRKALDYTASYLNSLVIARNDFEEFIAKKMLLQSLKKPIVKKENNLDIVKVELNLERTGRTYSGRLFREIFYIDGMPFIKEQVMSLLKISSYDFDVLYSKYKTPELIEEKFAEMYSKL